MTSFLKSAPLFLALAATPAFAQAPDPHADHHPADAATSQPDAKPDAHPHCPMMKGGRMDHSAGEAAKADGKAHDQMAMGSGGMAHCKMMQHAKSPAHSKAKPGAPKGHADHK